MTTAYNIKTPGLCKVSGRHLSLAANDAEAIQRDIAMHAWKLDDGYARRSAERAQQLEHRHRDVMDVIGRRNV